jgi:rhamnosyltransferase
VLVGIIVLYHPDFALLQCLLASLSGQVAKLVAVDNTPASSAALSTFFERFSYPISYIPLGENRGIAEAQNIGIRESIRGGCSHVLLLDQDTTLPSDIANKLLAAEGELLKAGKKVAAVGPQYIDEKTGVPSFAVRYRDLTVRKIRLDPDSSVPVETDILIASGSIIRTAALESVGMMRDDLFIDFVDTEWALRARRKGYKSYCVPNAIMVHSVGDAAIKVFGKSVYLHSDVRKYYRLRNAMYLLRLSSMGRQWRSYILRWIPYYFLLNMCISKNKPRNARLLLKALWNGLLGKLGPASQDRIAPDMRSDKSGLSFGEGRCG